MAHLREANETLEIAARRSEHLVEGAVAAREAALEQARIEAEGRRCAESVLAQCRASEEDLRVREREAQTANHAKDQFLAMLAHELRNPLAPIVIALDMIAADGADGHDREHAIIARQITYLVRLIDDLLDVTPIVSRKVEPQRKAIEVADITSRAIETSRSLLAAKGQVLTVDVPVRGLAVDADMIRLAQAIGNVLANASAYTPHGGSIALTAERRGATVLVRVRDTGIGISNEMLSRLFDVATQHRKLIDRAPGALGFGLAVTRSIVALHGGTVTARSDGLGCGTELTIEIPAVESMVAADTLLALTPRRVESVVASKILIVDDNRDATNITAAALTNLGHDVRIAVDPPSALAVVATFVPDVVLLDIGLPAMDGYALATRLRAALPGQEPRFIAISGYGQEIDHRRSARAGFKNHLVKPVDLATLQRCIDDSLRHLH